jgi:glycosyltransferase involved in cell wall biosynthesis
MHVALNAWFWEQTRTGSGQYLRGLVAGLVALKQADLRLTLISPRPLNHLPEGVQQVTAKPPLGGQVGKVWFEQIGYPRAVGRVGAELAHVPYWGAPLSSPARLLVSILDVIPLLYPVYRQGLGKQLYTSLVSASAQGAGAVITLSEASKKDICARLNLPPERVTPIYLAVDERFMPHTQPEDETVRRKYKLPDEFALYLGGFDARKNINTLLLAWTYAGQALGEHIPLVLAGAEPAWGTPRFPDMRAYARQLKIEKYLQWLGEVDEGDKPSLYRLAKAFIYPSRYEGFGLPVLEAMACGTPVIAAHASSIPEVVGEAGYLVEADDARKLGGAILAVLVQDDLHQNLANMGRGRATAFSWRKTAQATLQVYESLLTR